VDEARLRRSILVFFLALVCARSIPVWGQCLARTGSTTVVEPAIGGFPIDLLFTEATRDPVMLWDEVASDYSTSTLRWGRVADDLSVSATASAWGWSSRIALSGHDDRAVVVFSNNCQPPAVCSRKGWAAIADLDGRELTRTFLANDIRYAAAGWDGSAFAIVWTTGVDLYSARVGPDGRLVSGPRYLLSALDPPGYFVPSIETIQLVPLGDDLALVWQEGSFQFECQITCPPLPAPGIIRVARFRSGGVIGASLVTLQSETPRTIESHAWVSPAVASSDGLLAVAWLEQLGFSSERARPHVAVFDERLEPQGSTVIPSVAGFRGVAASFVNGKPTIVWSLLGSTSVTQFGLARVESGSSQIQVVGPNDRVNASPFLVPTSTGFIFVSTRTIGDWSHRTGEIVVERYDCGSPTRRRGARRP